MTALCGLTLGELTAFCEEQGQPRFRGTQIADWMFKKRALSLDGMTNLPDAWRAELSDRVSVATCQVRRSQRSVDDTVKLLVGLADGESVETVLIPEGRRRTVCVSTQVGCAMACAFCASGAGGSARNLSADEIVGQLLLVQATLPAGERISNVVYMGTGEPLANYDPVLKSIRIVSADWGMRVGARKITVSTVGLPDQIRRLAGEQLQVTLAVSLHSADEEKRTQILPIAGRLPLDDVLSAADEYWRTTGREVTFECVLLGGVNCSTDDAKLLADRVASLRCNINLIPFNRLHDERFCAPAPDEVEAFVRTLESRELSVSVRKPRGNGIDAACGQLRRSAEQAL